jgi:hypothetical protein
MLPWNSPLMHPPKSFQLHWCDYKRQKEQIYIWTISSCRGKTFFDDNRNALKPAIAQDNNRHVEYKTSHLTNSWDLLPLTYWFFQLWTVLTSSLLVVKIIIHKGLTSLSQAHIRRGSENFLDLKPSHVNNPFHHQPTMTSHTTQWISDLKLKKVQYNMRLMINKEGDTKLICPM